MSPSSLIPCLRFSFQKNSKNLFKLKLIFLKSQITNAVLSLNKGLPKSLNPVCHHTQNTIQFLDFRSDLHLLFYKYPQIVFYCFVSFDKFLEVFVELRESRNSIKYLHHSSSLSMQGFYRTRTHIQ